MYQVLIKPKTGTANIVTYTGSVTAKVPYLCFPCLFTPDRGLLLYLHVCQTSPPYKIQYILLRKCGQHTHGEQRYGT